MLYKIPNGSYIDLDCIQSVTPDYEGEHISLNDDNSQTTNQDSKPRSYLISLSNGQQLDIATKDLDSLTKVLIEEGLMMPDPQESEGVLSNDPWRNNGQQEHKDGKGSTE